jgi:hypothetical protein
MENLYIIPTSTTPEVFFDGDNGKLCIKGRSLLDNPIDLYKQLYNWIDTYYTEPMAEITFDVMLEYFNTSSAKCLIEMFKKLERFDTLNSKVVINWYFQKDDDQIREAGEDFQAIITLPFHIIELNQ